MLIAFRALQGSAGAILSPSVFSIVTVTFEEGKERNTALGILGGIAGSGAAIGVLLGGILTEFAGWEWVFFVNVPIGVLALFLVRRFVRESRSAGIARSFDAGGAFAVTSSLMVLVYALTQASQKGWGSTQTIALLLVSAVLMIAFLLIESRVLHDASSAGVLPPTHTNRSEHHRPRSRDDAGWMFFLLSLYMQDVLGFSALKTGMAYLAVSLTAIVASGISQEGRSSVSTEQRETLDAILRQSAFPADSDVNEQRRLLRELLSAQPLPADVTVTAAALGGVPTAEITVDGIEPRHVVLYFHGGVYVMGDAFLAADLASQVGRRTQAKVISVDYRLAPEHPYPAAVDDALAAYEALLHDGIAPSDIAFAGESAGGGLAIATLVNARDHGLPLPAAAFVMSPYADLTLAGTTMETRREVDPLLSREALQARVTDYTSGQDAALGLISPVFADLSGLPPLIIQAGTHEVLLDDAVRLAQQAATADVEVTLDITPGVPHVFQAYHPILDEAAAALDRAGRVPVGASRHVKTRPPRLFSCVGAVWFQARPVANAYPPPRAHARDSDPARGTPPPRGVMAVGPDGGGDERTLGPARRRGPHDAALRKRLLYFSIS